MADTNNDQNRTASSSSKQVTTAPQAQSGQTTARSLDPYRQTPGMTRASSPFSLMRRLMGDMDRLFGGWGTPSLWPSFDESFERSFWSPQIDVFERGHELVVHADLPGLRQEDVKVNVDQGVLTISGQRTQEQSGSKEGGMYHRERSFGSFQRSIALPEGTDIDHIRASFENGVLEVTAPVPQQARESGRSIPIGPKASPGPKH
ncbi:MAG TPA: Hsp20/alpha crystallin family protein [Polyangiaceae bacterium]